MTRRALFVLSFFGFLFDIGCGGSIKFTPSESPTVTSVSVSCTPTSIRMVQTSQCSATVSGTGSYSSGVTWTATDGTVTAGGVFTPSDAGTATITATSTEDTSKYGSAPVPVTDSQSPTITSVSVSCTPASILTGQTSQCSATVSGTGNYSSGVTWSATDGTVTAGGVFTPTAAGTATITATSTQDATKSGSAPVTVVAVTEGSCNITATGTIQADGSLGGDPFLGDVYQIQGTITANYVDDDEAGNSTVTFTAPDGHTVTVGMFLLNQHTNGTNTYAARVAAGYVSSGNWMPGMWTWSMNYSDRASNTCTATGSFTVQNAFAPSQGFLRQVGATPNLETDGNGKLFYPTGMDWYGSNGTYGEAEVPALAYVTVSGTAVTYVSGTNFTTQTLPSSVSNAIYLCTAGPGSCTLYPNVTINSSTSLTLGSSGGMYSSPIPAYLFFFRNIGAGFGHALGYEVTISQAFQFYAQWGTTFDRFPDGQGATVENTGGWLGTGYNEYNWNAATGVPPWGIPAVDLMFAAAHSAGIHLMFGGPTGDAVSFPCPSYTCTTAEQSNLQNFYAMIAARWGAFYDVLEVQNEGTDVPQTFVDYAGTVLETGVSGIAGGNPADPYGHFFTTSYFPNNPNYYTSTYGPFSSPLVSDAYLNFVDLPHQDNAGDTIPVYEYIADQIGNVNGCPGNGTGSYGGSTLPRFNGEISWPNGVPPSTQTASAPNNEQNGPRIVDEQAVLNQCGGTVFNAITDQISINSTTPITSPTWYDTMSGRTILQRFMVGLDTSAAPITVTLGGGCASSACSYAALGSSNHIRLVLNSATGNSSTGIPNTVRTGTVTLTVPQSGMTGNWVNPSTGAVISTISPSSGSQTLSVPSFQYDIYLQLD